MRKWICIAGLVLVAGTCQLPAAGDQPRDTKSALEADPAGWTDLLADGLSHWKRVSVPAGRKLSAKDPWKLDEKSKVLTCDGAGVHENLQYDKEFADGTFHVEWRFKKVEGKKGYNSGVYVRNSPDGKVWHQAQVGNKNVGYLFGSTLVEGRPKGFNVRGQGPQRGKEAGEWNTFEITCRGKTVTLWVNGAVTCRWTDCQVPRGQVGLEAEGWFIEFRNVKFKPLK